MFINYRLLLLLLPPAPLTLHLFLGDYMQHGYRWSNSRFVLSRRNKRAACALHAPSRARTHTRMYMLTTSRSFDLELARFRSIFPATANQLFIAGNHDIGHHSKCLFLSPPLLQPHPVVTRFERSFGPSMTWHKVTEHHSIILANPAALGADACDHGIALFWSDLDRISAELSASCPLPTCARTLLIHYPLGRPLRSKCTSGHFFGPYGSYTGYPWFLGDSAHRILSLLKPSLVSGA